MFDVSEILVARQLKMIAIVNQKGGVGKTTTAINLSAGLSEVGQRVLVVDLDAQGNASTGLGIAPDQRRSTSFDFLSSSVSINSLAKPSSVSGVYVIPSSSELASADMVYKSNTRRSHLLSDAMAASSVDVQTFDFIIFDCPPSLNLLTVNALVACNSVLIPMQSEFFALEGLSQVMKTIRDIRKVANPDLRIEGILLTMHDRRNGLAQMVEADVRANLGALVFETTIPRNVRVSEAPSYGRSVLDYDTQSKGAEAYRALAREVASRYDQKLSVSRGG